ncbi:hypothetical protein F5888DRAFT_1741043 [Russula emetica]|nr:hypothetical protein F5888DRAFT_1741043 [Russula emetica]
MSARAARHGPSPRFFCHVKLQPLLHFRFDHFDYFSPCTSIIPVAWSLAIATYSLSTLQVLTQRLGGKSHADNVESSEVLSQVFVIFLPKPPLISPQLLSRSFIPFPPLLSVAVLTGRFVNFHSLSPPRLTRGTSDFKAEQQIVVPNPACSSCQM